MATVQILMMPVTNAYYQASRLKILTAVWCWSCLFPDVKPLDPPIHKGSMTKLRSRRVSVHPEALEQFDRS